MKKIKKVMKYHLGKEARKKKLLKQTKKEKNIVYGARSIQKQIGFLARETQDYDILSKDAKKSAGKTKKHFNKISGKLFYTKPAIHKGTHKVMWIGNDGRKGTEDDEGVVDYSQMPRPRPRFKTINGVRYRVLSIENKRKKAILKDPEYKFRREKDKNDLDRIKTHNILRRKR